MLCLVCYLFIVVCLGRFVPYYVSSGMSSGTLNLTKLNSVLVEDFGVKPSLRPNRLQHRFTFRINFVF